MKIINMNEQKHVTLKLFTDNQPHVELVDIDREEEVTVICSMIDSLKILQLQLLVNALDARKCKKKKLIIPYLMGARSDRHMKKDHSDSHDLQVIAGIINSLKFDVVLVFDVHSDVSLGVIDNCFNAPNYILCNEFKKENSVLILPDAGAGKKAKSLMTEMPSVTDIIFCSKERNLQTQDLDKLIVLNPGVCENRDVVIVDDLCDGGRTFTGIMKQLPKTNSATLIIGHSLFSFGTKELEEYFTNIITSNSTLRNFSETKEGFLNVVDITEYLCQYQF